MRGSLSNQYQANANLEYWGGDSISQKTFYRKISQCPEGARSVVRIVQLLWNLAYCSRSACQFQSHDDVINWKHFPRYWPFVRGIHRWPVNSPHKVQWRGALMFSLICAWINYWVNNLEAGDLIRHCAHYDVIVIVIWAFQHLALSKLYDILR